MKLQLLHGAAVNNSRNKLLSIRKNFESDNVITFDNQSKAEEVLGEIMTMSLLSEQRLIIWENPPKGIKVAENPNLTLVLWFDTEIDPKDYLTSRIESAAEVFFFPEEKEASIFPLLDALGSREKKAFFELEKRNRTSPNDTQYILTMVFYLLRSLAVTPKLAKDFIKRKNETMRKNFSKQELINLYRSVIEIDFKIKSGLLEIPQAEFSLVNLFTH